VIRTGQHSLKFMMTQRLVEGIHHKLLMKLLEFNYVIEYKKGTENKVADALSRKEHTIMAISTATPAWVKDIEHSYSQDPYYSSILEQVLINSKVVPHYSAHAGILQYKGKICVCNDVELKNKILASLQSSALGGHSGIRTTYQRIKRIFIWPSLKKYVETFVTECL
jgi:hypothetical protein